MSSSREPGADPRELGLPGRVIDDVVDPAAEAFARLVAVQAKLRRPDGCPWDREQTHDSLARHLLEETYEVLEAIDHGDLSGLREELGDLVLQVVFHAYLGYEDDAFTIADVLDDLRAKLVHRHPHVFGEESPGRRPGSVGGEEHADQRVSAAENVLRNWERIKRAEKGRSVMEGVPRALPALSRAAKLSRRAAQVGFDWPTADGAREKVLEELDELTEEAGEGADPDRLTDEVGDLLFAVVSWARKLDVEPETALRRASDRFAERFTSMEAEAAAAGRELESLSPDEWARYWDRANPATGADE